MERSMRHIPGVNYLPGSINTLPMTALDQGRLYAR